jgi:hypothetical protein
MATNTKPLKKWSTDELETAIRSNYFHDVQKSEAESILREREREPDRKLARRTYNAAAWTRAYSEGTFIVALIILWFVATGEPPPATSVQAQRQPAEAAKPETSLLAAPPIETAKPETSSLAVPPIAAPQEATVPPTEAAKPETSPPAAPPIETAEPEDLPPAAPTVAAPAETPSPSPEAHPAGIAPAIASPEEPLGTPTPPNAASTGTQPAAPAADVTAPPRQRTSNRPRRSLSAPRQTTDAWKKGISIFGQ